MQKFDMFSVKITPTCEDQMQLFQVTILHWIRCLTWADLTWQFYIQYNISKFSRERNLFSGRNKILIKK
jgi:hypothetical protein